MSKALAIRPQAQNANAHTQRGMGVLEKSIEQHGWIGAPTIAADGESFDGSARIETGANMGFDFEKYEVIDAPKDKPLVVRSEGRQPIFHMRADIPTADDPRAKALGVIANRSAELNLGWDASVLAGLGETIDLSTMFSPDEMAKILEDAATDLINFAPGSIDEQGRLDEKAKCKCPNCGHIFTP